MTAPSAETRFGFLLDRVERVGRLDVDELSELTRLYRLHVARLARVRERADDPERLRTLNALCVRAHTILHVPAAPRRRRLAAAMREALAGTRPVIVLAAGLLAMGVVVGAALGLRDAAAVHALVPAALGYDGGDLEALLASAEARARFLARGEVPVAANTIFGATLFVNNTRVGLLAFATGLLAGIPSVVLTVYNGLLLGVFSSIFLRDGLPVGYLAWILPHGIPELTALALCGAGGLVFGGGVVAPGRLGRRRAIVRATGRAFALLGLALPLVAIAAVIESFVRESALSTEARFAVAALQVMLVAWALRWTRRTDPDPAADLAWIAALQSAVARTSR